MMIVKVGGGLDVNRSGIAEDLTNISEKVIFVHGGREQTNLLAQNLNQPTRKIVSPSGITSIYTDGKAMELMLMTYSGLLNKSWVAQFSKAGLRPIGLSGADGNLWQAERKKHLIAVEGDKQKLVKDTFTGRVIKVNKKLIETLLKDGYLPVITQPAITESGELVNTDNDLNLAVMAEAMGVETLVNLFEAPGLLKNLDDSNSLIRKVDKNDLPQMMRYAKGTMKKKILGAVKAFDVGVRRICWGDSRVKRPIESALAGKGTVISG